MKILITTDTYEPAVNGVVSSIKTLSQELLRLGHDVRILAPSTKNEVRGNVYYIKALSVQSIYPDARLAYPKLLPLGLMADLIEWKPDIIHAQTEFSTYLTARKIARSCKAPIVNTVHTYYEDYTQYFAPSDELGRLALKRFMHLVLRDSAAIIVPSMKIASVLERYGLSRPVFCIPTGIPLEKFKPQLAEGGDKELKELKKSLGIPEENFVFISLGRVGKEKNPGMLLKAFSRAIQAGLKQASLLYVGDGPALEGLKQEAQRLSLGKTEVLFAGRVSPDKVAAYYQLADMFVCASNSETQGLTYLEALSSGTPLLVKHDLCLQGVLREGTNGYGFSSEQECAELMCKLRSEPELIGHLSLGAELSAQEHSASSFGKTIEDLYHRVLERASSHEKELFGGRLIGLEHSAKDKAEEISILRDQVLTIVTERLNLKAGPESESKDND